MKQERLLLFAGTTEGRRLFHALEGLGIPVDISVATEYGGSLLDVGGYPNSRILVNRLSAEEMQALLHDNGYTLVVDATHPYAVEVTANIRKACEQEGVMYMRLLRPQAAGGDVVACENLDEAVRYLAACEGNILSTIGSKELAALTRLEGYQKRVFARILPLPEAVEACVKLGFGGQNLICMQGPFSYEMNVAMLRQYHCRYLLTKDSGKAGGMDEKMQAAAAAGAKVIMVCRPMEQNGLSYEEVLQYIVKRWDSSVNIPQKKSHFPLFVPAAGKQVLVVGGGAIATRRVHTLCRFDWKVKVVAPQASSDICELADKGELTWLKRPFMPADLEDIFLVTAATDRREVNEQVAVLAKERGIYASIADCRDACSFYFPALIEHGDMVIGIVGDGYSHKAVSQTARQIREVLGNEN